MTARRGFLSQHAQTDRIPSSSPSDFVARGSTRAPTHRETAVFEQYATCDRLLCAHTHCQDLIKERSSQLKAPNDVSLTDPSTPSICGDQVRACCRPRPLRLKQRSPPLCFPPRTGRIRNRCAGPRLRTKVLDSAPKRHVYTGCSNGSSKESSNGNSEQRPLPGVPF